LLDNLLSFRCFTFFCFILFLLQCYTLGVEDMEHISGEELHTPDSFLVIFNGSILGKHRRPQVLVCFLSHLFIIYIIFKYAFIIISYIVNLNILLLKRFATALRKLRRACRVGVFVSVYVNEKQVNSSVAVDSFSLFSYCFILFSRFLVHSFF
jgi:DNA-directed RNA polymerase III subunit RPC2